MRSTRSVYVAAVAALVAGGLFVSPAQAAAGDLDHTFDADGKVTTDFAGGSDSVRALVVQLDGKLVAGGQTVVGGTTDFALVRYNTDGTLDATFGTGGKVTTDFTSSWDQVMALVIQPDGKLVAAGGTSAGNSEFGLARYNTDGSLDATFGTDGKVTTDFPEVYAGAFALVLQPDGKLVAAGGDGYDFAVARFNADGSPDATFGTGGKVTTDFAGASDFAVALVLQPDGKLVAAGRATLGHVDDFGLVRYNADGSLDPTFGTGGKTTTDFAGGFDMACALALQPDGKLVAAGTQGNDFALARYTTDGSLDVTFGADGKTTTDFAGRSDGAAALVLQPDGKLVVAGPSGTSRAGGTLENFDFTLARYTTDGSLDATFGTEGSTTTDYAGGVDQAGSLVLQPDGKLVAAGTAGDDIALARYQSGNAADLSLTTRATIQRLKGVPRVTYTLTVSNAGPNPASGIQLTDRLPAGATFVSVSPSQGSCSTPPPGVTGTVTCALGGLASSAGASVQIVVDVKAKGKTASVTNTASVTSATADPALANNSQTTTTQVK